MELSKQKAILVRAGYWLLVLLSAYICLRYLALFLLPVLLGFLIAWMLRPLAGFLERHSGLERRGASIISALMVYIVLGVLLWLVLYAAARSIAGFQERLPRLLENRVMPLLRDAGQRLGVWERRLGAGAEARQVTEALESVAENALTALSGWLMNLVANVAQSLPALGLGCIFTILSSVIICGDYEAVTNFVMRQIPQRMHAQLLEIRDYMAGTLWKLAKAYLILTAVTFAEIALGLWILRVEGFLIIAGLTAILDLLPVIGSGVALVPWGIGMLLAGHPYTGVGLLILWSVVTVMRQILEPRVVGKQIGLHPLVTLTAMYVGLRLAGFAGLLLAPVLCLLLQHLQEKRLIQLYR